ncbi:MAG: nitronate monooxygenase [Opitutales bacterium]
MDTYTLKENKASLPSIIQGGMGIGVSNWELARAVSQRGGLGVVSGSALDTVLIRRLQDGDLGGHMRRALEAYPNPATSAAILERWFQPEGRRSGQNYRVKALPTFGMDRDLIELMIVGSFVEVYLAKEGHSGWVGFNILEKTQVQSLPALLGAMLAGVDAVLMGGGIPLSIPAVLDNFAQMLPAELKVHVLEAGADDDFRTELNPQDFLPDQSALKRPLFFPVISSEILAKTLLKKGSGRIDGFVIEKPNAGGHNAPPRRGGEYGPKDQCNVESIRKLGLPFWLAGGEASPGHIKEAQEAGAQGIQAGSIFALSKESGIEDGLKLTLIESYFAGNLDVITDFKASPTGYPLKRAEYGSELSPESCRVCDLGYLRQPFMRGSGTLGYRCPAAPLAGFVRKGGAPEEAEGKQCLCNGLLATVGLGRLNFDGQEEAPLVTIGQDLTFLHRVLPEGKRTYSVEDVFEYLLGSLETGSAIVKSPETQELQAC